MNAVGESNVGGTPANGPLLEIIDLQLTKKLNKPWASTPSTNTSDSGESSILRSCPIFNSI